MESSRGQNRKNWVGKSKRRKRRKKKEKKEKKLKRGRTMEIKRATKE